MCGCMHGLMVCDAAACNCPMKTTVCFQQQVKRSSCMSLCRSEPTDQVVLQMEGMHGLPSLPAVPPTSVPYPSLEALASIAEGIGTSGGGEVSP